MVSLSDQRVFNVIIIIEIERKWCIIR